MGAGPSVRVDTLLAMLTQEVCPASHQIWQSVSLAAFSDPDLSRLAVLEIKEKRPENIPELIRFSVSKFSDISVLHSVSRFNISSFCEFLSVLLVITASQKVAFGSLFPILIFRLSNLPILSFSH
jgi:hypothetical protein